MLNYKSELVEALNTILPTHYEMFVETGIKTPCITYIELSNVAEQEGDTLRYSRLGFRIQICGTINDDLFQYIEPLDQLMFSLGFKRKSYNEIIDNPIVQLVFTYEALALEN